MQVAVLVAAFGATVATAAAAALPRAAPGDSPPGAGSAIHEPILPGLPFRLPTGRRDPVRGEAGAPPSPLSAEPAWTPLTITPRSGHAAVYDPVRRRMLVLGGTDCWEFHNSVTALSLSGSPSWRALLPGGGPPAGRDQTIAVYDSKRDHVVLFGGRRTVNVDGPPGSVCVSLGDTWDLSLAEPPAWALVAKSGPPARWAHAAIYDPVRDRVLVSGGRSLDPSRYFCESATPLADLWELPGGGTAWRELSQSGDIPPPGTQGSSVYDPVRDRMLLVSGGRIWALALAGGENHWTLLQVSGPAPAAGPAIYDPSRDRILVYDGARTWTLGLVEPPSWALLSTEGAAPNLQSGYSATWDARGDRMLIFGGSASEDTWSLSFSGPPRWSVLDADLIPALAFPRTLYDEARDRMLVVGDYWTQGVYEFSLTDPGRWAVVATVGPRPARGLFASAVLDPIRDRVVVIGGPGDVPGAPYIYQLQLAASPPRWSLTQVGEETIAVRAGTAAIYDSRRDRILIFGGMLQGVEFDEVWQLTLDPEPILEPLATSGAGPSPRSFSVAVYDPVRDRMLVYGGYTVEDYDSFRELWALDLEEMRWEQLSRGGPAVEYPRMLYDPVADRIVVVGGYRSDWGFAVAFDLAYRSGPYPLDDYWDDFTPPPRGAHGAIYDPLRDALVVVDGVRVCRGDARDLWSWKRGRPVRDVAIDIRPGSDDPTIRLSARGVLPAAILGQRWFDVTTVDPRSVRLAGAGVRLRGNGDPMAERCDVNRDGLADLMLHVEARNLSLTERDTVARLTAWAPPNFTVRGAERVRVVVAGPDATAEAADGEGGSAAAGGELRVTSAVAAAGARGIRVSFGLATLEPARLDLVDLGGRLVGTRRVAGANRGPHVLTVAEGATLAPGVYFVRLSQAGRVAVAKAIVLR